MELKDQHKFLIDSTDSVPIFFIGYTLELLWLRIRRNISALSFKITRLDLNMTLSLRVASSIVGTVTTLSMLASNKGAAIQLLMVSRVHTMMSGPSAYPSLYLMAY